MGARAVMRRGASAAQQSGSARAHPQRSGAPQRCGARVPAAHAVHDERRHLGHAVDVVAERREARDELGQRGGLAAARPASEADGEDALGRGGRRRSAVRRQARHGRVVDVDRRLLGRSRLELRVDVRHLRGGGPARPANDLRQHKRRRRAGQEPRAEGRCRGGGEEIVGCGGQGRGRHPRRRRAKIERGAKCERTTGGEPASRCPSVYDA